MNYLQRNHAIYDQNCRGKYFLNNAFIRVSCIRVIAISIVHYAMYLSSLYNKYYGHQRELKEYSNESQSGLASFTWTIYYTDGRKSEE